jgi:hypothetical protein
MQSIQSQKLQSLVVLIDQQKKILRQRKAYRDGLPLDFYEDDDLDLDEEECVYWPYDYMFISQLHYLYENMQGARNSGKSRKALLEEVQQRSNDMS